MADSHHGPEHPAHLHTAFEDPEAQAESGVIPLDDANFASGATRGSAQAQTRHTESASQPLPQQRRRKHRHHSQPIGTQSPSRPRSRGGVAPAASSPPVRPRRRRASTAAAPSAQPLLDEVSPSASPLHSLSVSLSPSPHLSSSSLSARSARRYLPPAEVLDGATLAAACAAAPIASAFSHRSYAPSTHRGGGGGGLYRNDSSSGAPIHPDILDDLRALDDLEGGALLRPLLTQPPQPEDDGAVSRALGGGGGGGDGEGGGEGGRGEGGEGGGHVDEAETYEVPELLEAKPRDVLQFIEEEGVVKLGEFEVADGLVLKAFGGEPFLVLGHEHAEPPGLREMWLERLGEGGKMQGTGWTSTLSVEAHVVNLYDAAAPGLAGLLRPLLARLRVHGCPPTVFALPALQAVIAYKWNTWARHFLFAEFVFYAAWLASFSAFSLLLEDGDDPDEQGGDGDGGAAAAATGTSFRLPAAASGGGGVPVVRLLGSVLHMAATALSAEPSSAAASYEHHHDPYAYTGGVRGSNVNMEEECPMGRLLNPWDWGALRGMVTSPRGLAQLGASAAALAAMLPFAYVEVCTLAVQGLAWVNLFNLADVLSYFLTMALWFAHLRCGSLPASAWFSGALALQHVLLWTKLHYYARVLTPTRGGFNDTIRMVLSELRTFLTFVGLVMLGFAFAFYCLFRQDRDDFSDFATLWHSFASMFAYMLQMFDYSVLYNSTHPVLAMVLFMAYELMVAVLLLNIMIALMTAAFARVSADEGLRYLIYKAEVIDELESTLPQWLMRASWFPHFVHVLKVSPRSTYEINLNSVWSGMSNLQSSLMNAQQETRLRVETLEGKMDVIDQKLSATVRLLASRLLTHNELAAALSMDDVAEADEDEDRERDEDLLEDEPDPEHWRDADLDPAADEQAVPDLDDDDEGARVVGALAAGRRRGGAPGPGLRPGPPSSRRGREGVGGGGGGRLSAPSSPYMSEAYGTGYGGAGGGGLSHRTSHAFRSAHASGHPAPRRHLSTRPHAQGQGHAHCHAAYHSSAHPSHASSSQLPARGISHHIHHSTSHQSRGGGAACPGFHGPTHGSPSPSLGPSRDPSDNAGLATSPHPARTGAGALVPGPTTSTRPLVTSGARLHAFYSHGHGQSYHHHNQNLQAQQQQQHHHHNQHQQPQQQAQGGEGGSRSGARTPPLPYRGPLQPYQSATAQLGGGGESGSRGNSGSSGGGMYRPGTAPAAAALPYDGEASPGPRGGSGGSAPAATWGEEGDGIGIRRGGNRCSSEITTGPAPEGDASEFGQSPSAGPGGPGVIVLEMWRPDLRPSPGHTQPPVSPSPRRDDAAAAPRGSMSYYGARGGGGYRGGGDGGGGGGGGGPVMASIAENGSPSLAESGGMTDGSAPAWSPTAGSEAGSGARGS